MAAKDSPFTGKGAPRQEARRPLAEAGTGGGNRIRRLDRRRHGAAGCLQGPARRQAGGRGGGRDAEEKPKSWPSRPKRRKERRAAKAILGGDGRADLPSRQGAVAGCRRQASRSPSWNWRAITKRSAPGCCRISRAGPAPSCARRTASRASSISSSAMPCRGNPTCWTKCRSRATASPICRSTGSKRWRRWRRPAGWSCIPGTARRASPMCRGVLSSISIPRPIWLSTMSSRRRKN